MDEERQDDAFKLAPKLTFLLELGRALQRYGAPAHRLEEALTRVAGRLGMESQYFCVPTAFFAFIGEKHRRQRTYLERTQPGGPDLAKLSDVYGVAREVALGRLGAEAAHGRLRAVVEAPPVYGTVALVVASALAAAMAADFFGGGWADLGLACLLGLVSGLAPVVLRLRPALAGLAALLGALVVSLGANAAVALGLHCSPTVVTLASLVNFLPGLGLIIAMNELATGNLVSGTARFSGVAMTFLQLAFGVLLGHQLGRRWFTVLPTALPPLPGYMALGAVGLAAVAFMVLFQARRRDFGWILGACALGFAGARLGAWLGGAEFGVGLGAWLLGVGSNLFSRRFDRPSLTTLLPGLMILVPGSWGFRSLGYLFQDQVVLGLDTAVHMAVLAMSLLVGLLLANATVRPRMVL
jgi:uncharacterized membrane protein YjjP (DUF1212 family)